MNISPILAQLPGMRSASAKHRGRPPKTSGTGGHQNNLLALRLALRGQPSQAEVGKAVGLTEKTYGKRERGETKISDAEAKRFARYFHVDQDEITGTLRDRTVPISGYVGAGAEIYPVDDGADFGEVECPRGLNPNEVVAVEVRGDSMSPISDGWILFYTKTAHGVPAEALNQMCVVKLTGGPLLVKKVYLGNQRGRYNLISTNATLIENTLVEWAAPVRGIVDPELAGKRPN